MTARPWEREPDQLAFEADGLPCVMRRNDLGVWCGYVGVSSEHPLFGLPTNYPLKLPAAWFEHRKGLEGSGVFDVFLQAASGKELTEACAISLALQVHGGLSFADDHTPYREPDGRWWFGFDCGHAGDLVPGLPPEMMNVVLDMMPEGRTRDTMREIMSEDEKSRVYRDQQYVVAECQSLAAQLVAIVNVLETVRAQTT